MSLVSEVARKSRPFIMHGEPTTTRRRPSIADPPDRRAPEVPVRALTPSELRMLARDTALDPRFRAIDRYLWRWAVGQGSGLPLSAHDADTLPESKPPPLPADDSITIDIIVLHAPDWARAFVFMWFRSDKTVEQMAQRLKCRVRAVYDERKLVLAYFLGRLTEAGIRIPTWEAT